MTLSQNSLRAGLLALAVVAPLGASLPLSPAAVGQTPQSASTPKLAGLWEVTGEPDPAAGISTFVNFVRIGRDGTIVNADPEVGVGVGEARRAPGGGYTVGFFGFLDAPVPTSYEVQSSVTLAGQDGFSGPFRTVVRDEDGTFLFDYEGTVSAIRVHPQPY